MSTMKNPYAAITVFLSGKKEPILRIYYLLLMAGCVLVYLKNYWLAEDAYINFRALDQLWAGHGPVWNQGERVQVYTSALWYWLVAGAKFFIRDDYLVTFACSFVLYLLTLEKVARLQAGHWAIALGIFLLLSSNSFMDFAGSGLENVLIYFLLMHFFGVLVERDRAPSIKPYLIAALLLTARHDLLVLIFPACIQCLWLDWLRCGWRKTARFMLLGGIPFIVWELFSLIYYGFPFPNTAYAKLSSGIPESEMLAQGLRYVTMTSRFDPLLPCVVLAGLVAGMVFPTTRALGRGVILNVAYVIYVGGDYMRGRFFSNVYLVSVLLLLYAIARLPKKMATAVLMMCLLLLAPYHFAVPFTPVTAGTEHFDHEKIMETANERGIFYGSTSLSQYFACRYRHESFPTWPFYIQGLELNKEHKAWHMMTNIGMMGYAMDLNVHIFDRLALADPLLARLPTSQQGAWTPGHFARDMPWGYVDANLTASAPIYDPDLDEYYRPLRIITRSPDLFSRKRLEAIFTMNLVDRKHLLAAHTEGWKLRGCQACVTVADEK